MARSTVAILRTSPATVLRDYHTLMNLAGYQDVLAKDADTALKVNISWHFFFPGSSTTPWQLDGVIRAMKADGFDPALIHACHNRTVVIDAHLGERENKQVHVVEAHGLRNIHIYESEEWMNIREAVGDLTRRFLCLNDVYPRGFMIPRRFVGENIVHLPTVKTHVFTTTTGAMKNAFGGLLNEHRHWTHPVIHETLVDLLMIQKQIHRGVFAVMDGTFAGDGPGPRCMVPHVKNVILASADQVAIDATAAKLMGMDPLSIKYIRLAHDLGLGCGDPREIDIVGDASAAAENWHFTGPFRQMTFASRMQHHIYWGPMKRPVEWTLKTVLAPWAYIASVLYHDSFWYPVNAKRLMRDVLDSPWGRLFRNWETATATADGFPDVGTGAAAIEKTGFRAFRESLGVLGTCVREALLNMSDFSVRSDNIDVEQIMRQIRARIRERRGVDYTEEEIRELANVKLEKFLDPRSVRSDLLEQFRRTKAEMPAPKNFAFEESTLYETHRGIIRWIRKLLNPILKLLFNPNPLIQALHIQSELNTRNARREELDALHFEVMHNLVVELTRLGIEVKNLKMRLESMASRLDFDERRARALEGVVMYRPGTVAPLQPPSGDNSRTAETDQERRTRRRRRRPRRRPGDRAEGPAPSGEAGAAPGGSEAGIPEAERPEPRDPADGLPGES